MYIHKLSISLYCLVTAVFLAEGLTLMRKRRADCDYGTYQHEGKTCCLCPSGYKVVADCMINIVSQCELCEAGSFTAQPNRQHTCQSCKVCSSNANMETEKQCSQSSNTVCRCQDGHYCDKGDQCRVCYPCDTCEEHGGVKIKCTATNNTVCNGVEESKSKTIGTAICVVLALIVLILASAVFLWRRKMFCFRDKGVDETQAQEPLTLPKDVDLHRHLQEIASVMTSSLMKDVARRTGMTPADIEQHEKNHPGDVKEQTYRLLLDWSQAQGLKESYPTLITTLWALKAKTTADQIRQIVEG